jgi:hypothetical protein
LQKITTEAGVRWLQNRLAWERRLAELRGRVEVADVGGDSEVASADAAARGRKAA